MNVGAPTDCTPKMSFEREEGSTAAFGRGEQIAGNVIPQAEAHRTQLKPSRSIPLSRDRCALLVHSNELARGNKWLKLESATTDG
jgi:hypothetical protein